ncbi:ABC transporter ATP-binding protein [Cohnella caldifontis]|uniref:dipeptide ABC transporter ATP-binding protein n=1 Tax=Cohnella caldifontis TaxID=3027471 RepID=UPI0023ED4C41|nr:ABC transporter ATP-binding protein [Cohnella sp. YIM B05605]
MELLLEASHLTVELSTPIGELRVIDDVSIAIRSGETVCLVGESGSGKTVLSKTVMRVIDQENGRIVGGSLKFEDTVLTRLPADEVRPLRGSRMAMVFQEPMSAFDPAFTIGSQIAEAIVSHRQGSRRQARAKVVELLRKVGVPEPEVRMKQYPGELSGGLLQRAMIAMALSCDPKLLIADEPTTALDATVQAQILALLKDLQAEFRMALLLITHDLGVAAAMADRIVVMYAGRVAESGTAEQILTRPYHPYTRGLLNAVVRLDGPRRTKLPSMDGSIQGPAEYPSGCGFRPRCPFATSECAERPPLAEIDGRQAACWHAAKLAQSSEIQAPLSIGATPPPNRSVRLPMKGDGQARAPLLEVVDLRRHYPMKRTGFAPPKRLKAVDGVSLSLSAGETLGLVGESGSGKSTLGRVILQLEQATSGKVAFQGRELTGLRGRRLREVRRSMQMIFQDPYGSMDPRWTVGQIIGEPLSIHENWSGKEKTDKVKELLLSVGLDPSWRERRPHELSGGQKQRVGIARALALDPAFILADEPISALDVSVQSQILNLLQELQDRRGLSYLLIAHGLNAVRHLSDRVGVMYLGKLVEIAPSEELFRHPAHPYTRALIDSVPPLVPGWTPWKQAVGGEIPSPLDPPSGCRFHPRCPFATSRCKEEEPAWREIGPARAVACHYPV